MGAGASSLAEQTKLSRQITELEAHMEMERTEHAQRRRDVIDEQRRNSDLQQRLIESTAAEREARNEKREAGRALKAAETIQEELRRECDHLREMLAGAREAETKAHRA